jgi:alpha-glucosidase
MPFKRYILLFIAGFLVFQLQARDVRDGLLAEGVAVFYPTDFDSAAHMPSFALTKEFPKIAEIPSDWKLRPIFWKTGGRTCVTIPVNGETSLYGNGEVTGPLLRNGTAITLWNTDNYKYKADNGRRLYQSHPWVLGVRADGTAFGVLADNSWKQELSLKKNITFTSESPAFRVILIQKKSPQEVLVALSELVGKMDLPPLWSLGYHQCRYSYYPDSRAKQIADEFRNRRLPCDVIWFDIDYMDRFKVFTFDQERYPDPADMNRYLHDRKFKSIWMIDPGVKLEEGYSVYDSGTKADVWVKDKDGNDFIGEVWPGECKFPDFTQPKTRQWWSGLYKDYMATGIDGVWNDMNEPSVFNGVDNTMSADNKHLGGGCLPAGLHLRYHNVYGTLMIKSSREGIMKFNPDKRPFILSRSGFLGSHRYGATWTGDNEATMEHLKLSVPTSLNLGLSGQFFSGSDIGGFSLDATPELYGQWIALGTFYPFSRGHAANDTNDKEPWAFGTEIEKVAQVALNRRYRLMPYLYTIFQEASSTGVPVMQPVFFADPKDTTLRREEQSFLLGTDLMITPKWAVQPAQPKGNWRLVSLVGENSLSDTYQPDVTIREGAIVPLGKAIQNTAEYRTDSLTLLVSTDKDGNAVGRFYEDAGEGYDYQQGRFAEYVFKASTKKGKIKIESRLLSGQSMTPKKHFNIILVNDHGQKEYDWKKGPVVKVKPGIMY